MDIQKETNELLKKALWSTNVTEDQVRAARSIAISIATNANNVDSAWQRYEASLVGTKSSPINKRKFKDLFKELTKTEVRYIVHYLSATSSPKPQAV